MSSSQVSSSAIPLSGRVALVTGASRSNGIGFAVARRLGQMGARLFLHGWPFTQDARYVDDGGVVGRGVVDLLRADGITAEYTEHDFMAPAGPETVVQEAVDAFGHLDIVDANHAYSRPDRLENLESDELDRHLLVNVRGTLMLVKAFAAQHDGRSGGRVFMMTSGQHLGATRSEISYMTSKGAIHQATRSLSASLIGRGITVNTINPGPVDTGYPTGEQWQRVLDRMPMERWGEPDDVARLIGWLCTDDARWITGQVIDSEGGFRHAWG